MSTQYTDNSAGKNGTAGDESRFESQNSLPAKNRVICSIIPLQVPVEDKIEQRKGDDEELESNIHIKNPYSHIEDGGISLEVHVKKAEQGFRVHRIISGGYIHKSPIREHDVIIRVNDIDIASLSIEEVKAFFWKIRLDIDATIKLTIIRRVDDETQTGGGFITQTLSIHLNIEVYNEEGSNSRKGVCYDDPNKYLITIRTSSGPRFLCVKEDKLVFLPEGKLETQTSKWKLFACQDRSPKNKPQYYLLRNPGNEKFLTCKDGEDTKSKVLDMYTGDIPITDELVSCDRRWFQICSKGTKFQLQSLECKGWYLAVDDSQLLKLTQTESEAQFFEKHVAPHVKNEPIM